MSWTHISGTLHALPARRGDESGSYLWVTAGELRERVVAEMFLAAVEPDHLDGAIGVAVGNVHTFGTDRSGDVRLQFGRVGEHRGVVSATGAGIDTDITFALSHHPPEGGFCPRCGSELEVDVVDVITPPDGGVIGRPEGRCSACGMV
ncbi:MAG: hypothetical protein ACTHNU_05715 [Gaiellales bacterium]